MRSSIARAVVLAAALLGGAATARTASVAASGVVHWRDVDLPVEFHAAGDFAVLTARLPDGHIATIREIAQVDDAIAVLGDQRLAFAWPALLDWAGANLEDLRDRAVARAEAADAAGLVGSRPRNPSEQFADSAATVATLQLEAALWTAGRRDEAAALLRKRLAATPAKPMPGDEGYARVAIGDRLATRLFESGDTASAQTVLERLRADPAIVAELRVNADVNAAMVAARAGQAQAALVVITAALARFRGQADDETDENMKLPDSEAQFAGIKACALARLGRRRDADALLRRIVPPEAVASSTQRDRILLAGYRCIGDAPGLARELARQLANAPPAADVFRAVQPVEDYAPDRATLAQALREPVLIAAMRGKARTLPETVQPAVAGWRQGAGALDGAVRDR